MFRTDAPTRRPGLQLLVVLVLLAASVLLPETASAQSDAEGPELRACDGYMELYARSASRKLARALSGQGYRLETLELPDEIEADRNGQATTYEVYREKDGRAAGLVDATRRARRSFVVVGTEQGLVVTSHKWPSRTSIDGGTKCRPTSSRIEFPRVAVRAVDVEPFKYWGLRISWHLPESFDAKSVTSDRDFVKEVIGSVSRGKPENSDSAKTTSSADASEDAADNADRQKADSASNVDEDKQAEQ